MSTDPPRLPLPVPPPGAADPEPPAPPLEPPEVMHKTRAVEFLGRRTPIVYQNDNGPCPLLAICNVLLLKNVISLNPDAGEVSQQKLLALVAERLIDSNSSAQGKDEEYVRNWERNISDAIDLLPRLATGIDVNVMFRKVDDFEFMRERAIFELLDIPLYHGWIVDPQDSDTAAAIGSKSYNALASGLAEFKSGKPAEENKHVTEEETVDFAAATTAALGVPSSSVSHGISFDENTLSDSAEQQLRRGDREEDEELRRVLSLSKAESTTVVNGSVSFSTSQGHSSSNMEETTHSGSFRLEEPEMVGGTNKEEHDSHALAHDSVLQNTNSVVNVSEDVSEESKQALLSEEPVNDGKGDMLPELLDIPVRSSESTLVCPSHESAVLDDQAAAVTPDLSEANKETCREHFDEQIHNPQASDTEASCDSATVTSQATSSCASPAINDKIDSEDTPKLVSSSVQESEPIYQGEEHILGTGNMAFENQEPVYEGEVVLAEQADKTENSHCLDNGAAEHQWELIDNFLQSTANQLTVYGLFCLQEDLNERELCVFFRNNHFNTMFKYNGSLYLLATDQGFFSQTDLVWQKLDEVNGDGVFFTSNFTPFKAETPRNDSWNEQQALTTTADYLAQFDNSALPHSSENSNLELAIALQQQEFDRQPQRHQPPPQQQQPQQQQQQQQTQTEQTPNQSYGTGWPGLVVGPRIIPAYSEKEMLAIEPHFPFGLNKEVACSLEESKDNFLGKSLSVSGAGEVNNPDASDEPLLSSAHAGLEGNISETATSSSLVVTRAVDAPMSSSLGAMGPLLRKLGLLLSDDYPLTKPWKEGLELLKDDLEEISAALLELSATDSRNQMAKFWMDEARELSFDIDDFVDDMLRTHSNTYAKITPVRPHRVGRLKTTLLRKNLKSSTRTTKMAELWNLVQEASERHDRYVGSVTVASTTPCHAFTGHGRASGLSGGASNHMVGNDDLKTKLIEWLTDKAEKQLKVVPVVGPAGVGKTTLAKQVYREVGGQFECWAFVRVSRKPDMRRLLGGILSQVQRHRRPSGTSCCTVQVLIDNVTKHLRDKRYIIVIDDMWETTAWDIVKRAFPDSNNGSRIMTTTETEGMALECCGYQSNSNILEMEPLGIQECGKLFFNMVFGPGHPCPEQFKKISDRIIEKCAGLPLATICVAGLLASRPDNSELWHHVQEYLCSNFSTCSTLEVGLQQILRLSYYSLPQYLKTCLMYFNIYLEGYTMRKADLVTQWIAEGFVYATEGKDTEEVAGSYFDELVSRGMILPVEINYNDEVLSCTLHHSVLDLIAHESNEEKFITALDYSQTITGFHGKARRLSLHFSNSRYATKPAGLTPSQARSLAFFGILRCMPSIVGFKLLRVLVLEFCDIIGCESLNLTGICRLFQLRYLKISCDVRVELPAQMQRLQYLETLDIHAIVSAVPLDIIHLPGLLHLSLGDKANLPEGIGRVRSLRTLHYFDLGRSSEYNVLSLGELMNLQDLHLTYHTDSSDEHLKKNLVALACSLGKLVNLKSVSLAPGAFGTAVCHGVWSHMSSPPSFLQRLELSPPICIFSRLPHWIRGLHKLRILTVVVTELLMKDVDMLTGLPDLKVLSLYVRQPTAESIIFRRGAFPALKYFKYTCGVLRLAFQEEALPKLQRLELGFNAHRGEEYDHLLTGIEHLPSLKEIGGIIGAAPGAEEQDRCTAESALEVAIQKHQRFSSYVIVKGADWVEEEHGPQEKQHLIEAEARNVTAGGRSVVPIVVECALLWGLTSVSGCRRKMEDAVVAVPRLTSLPLCVTDSGEYHPMPLRLRMHFCGVYSGHGGAEVARYCRDRLHTALVEELSKIEPVSVASLGPAELQNQWEKVFVDCFCRVDDEVLGKASRGGGQGGSSTSNFATAAAMVQPVAPDHVSSTAVVAVICSSHIIVANCGDSRVVLCRGKLWAQPLSLDHTPSREDERARIEAGGGKTLSCNGYQVLGLLPVSRSIGGNLKPWIIPVPEVTVVPRGKDDECLILASDGLWDVMSNEEACNAARKSILLWHKRNGQKSSSSLVRRRSSDSADPAAQAAAAYLLELALRKGSKDDITVIVVDLKAQRKFN